MLVIRQIINSVYSSNTFLLYTENSDECWLIDVGDADKVMDAIPKGKKLKGVLFTHTHYDHIYGINELLMQFPRLIVYTNEFGKKALLSPKLNCSRYHIEAEDIVCCSLENIVAISEGEQLNLFSDSNCLLSVYETTGHDKSCLCYSINGCFFSGDSYIPGLKVLASFPNSNRVDAEISRKRIIELSCGLNLYPGHGNIEYGR